MVGSENAITRDREFLRQALRSAQIRRGFCDPNPSVGAVVVKEDHVISVGYHWAAGHPHAEVVALEKLGDEARGATIYVTLEPCCSRGRTPACTELLIERGLSRVVFGFKDPNPKVSGMGAEKLKEAGVICEHVPVEEIDEFYQSYAYWQRTGKPWIIAKLALSLDGKIAGPHGRPERITGSKLNQLTHLKRRASSAILTSVRTVVQDDPQLNARIGGDSFKKPVYVLDRESKFPLKCQLWTTAEKITIFHGLRAKKEKLDRLKAKGAELVEIDSIHGLLDLNEAVDFLGQEGIHELWVEAGGKVFASFAKEGLINQALLYVAPKWLGSEAQPAFENGEGIFTNTELRWTVMGSDVLCEMKW